jgi:hypothetical protein
MVSAAYWMIVLLEMPTLFPARPAVDAMRESGASRIP